MEVRCPLPPLRQTMRILTGPPMWDAHETPAKMCIWAFKGLYWCTGSWNRDRLGRCRFCRYVLIRWGCQWWSLETWS